MRFMARSAAALLTTALIVGGTTTAAHAQSQTIKDKKGDVVQYDGFDDERGTVLSTNQSAKSGVDVRSMKVNHKKKTVVVTLKFARLSKETMTYVAFDTKGKKQPAFIMYSTSRNKGEVYDSKSRKVCSAKLKTKYGKSGSVTATIKRTCLKNPKRIKASAVALSFTMGDKPEDEPIYVLDVVSKSSVRTEGWTKWLKAS